MRICLFIVVAILGLAAESHGEGRADAIRGFLKSLNAEDRGLATARFDDPNREEWTFFPGKRDGLLMKSLGENQRAAFRTFLETSLGKNGFLKLRDVLQTEPVTDRGGGVLTGPGEYAFKVFGPIEDGKPWAWRLEGHHVEVSQIVIDDVVLRATPSFLGSSPHRATNGTEPLGREVNLARTIVNNASPEIKKAMVIATVPREIVTGQNPTWDAPKNEGIALASMTAAQRAAVRALAIEQASLHADDVVRVFAAKWDATAPESIYFAWFGEDASSTQHGYRITAPHWIMEYVNFQANGKHVHCVWRARESVFIPIATNR